MLMANGKKKALNVYTGSETDNCPPLGELENQTYFIHINASIALSIE